MAINQDEQRKASFKHVYGIQHTAPGLEDYAESLEAGHQIYSSELIAAGEDIAYAGSTPVTFTSSSVWTPSSGTGMANLWTNSSFVKTINPSGTDSNYEEVLMPMIQFDSGHESHGAYIISGQSTNGQQAPSDLVQNKSGRLKNWISPKKFGAGYSVQI